MASDTETVVRGTNSDEAVGGGGNGGGPLATVVGPLVEGPTVVGPLVEGSMVVGLLVEQPMQEWPNVAPGAVCGP